MKYGLMGSVFPMLLGKIIYEYTAKAVPEIDIREFKKKHLKEYKAIVERTSSVGSPKENFLSPSVYLVCYVLAYYKAGKDKITMDIFDGMVDAVATSKTMKSFYSGKDCFSQKEIDKYVKGSARSKERKYPGDWVYDFSYDLSVPEYFITYHECALCKIAKQEDLFFLMPHLCPIDYPTIEYKGGKLIRHKTLGNGDDCCDFHVVKP